MEAVVGDGVALGLGVPGIEPFAKRLPARLDGGREEDLLATDAWREARDWIAEAPDELMTIVTHRKAPALPFVPAELHGELVVSVVCCYAGSPEEGERVVKPLKRFGSPVLDLCTPKPFLEHQAMFDPSFRHGWWYYVRSCDVAELTAASTPHFAIEEHTLVPEHLAEIITSEQLGRVYRDMAENWNRR